MNEDGPVPKAVVVTHSGSFHPDDVFSIASLLLFFESRNVAVRVLRSRDPEMIKGGNFVVDVGGVYDEATDRFDHHQIGGAGARPNGVPYASFGLVWKKYGADIAGSEEAARRIDYELVQFIDAMDNGDGEMTPVMADALPYSIGNAILDFNPGWKEVPPDFDKSFGDAVNFAVPVLRRILKATEAQIEGEILAREVYRETKDKRVIVFDHKFPWEELIQAFPEPLFVVEPAVETASDIRWRLKAVRKSATSFANRKDLPASWAGKRDSALAAVTGVPDAIFCHNKRFVAFAKSKQGALALAKKALES